MHAQDELEAHGGEGEDERVPDGATEEAVVGEAHVVLEADVDGRNPDVLAREAQVRRVAERVGDQRQHHDHHREHEEVAQMPVGSESAPECGARTGGARSLDWDLGDGSHGFASARRYLPPRIL